MDIKQSIIFDLPIPYKNIKIYPAIVRDYGQFMGYSECFSLEKNSIPDPKIISMTELEYLYYLYQTNKKHPYLIWFDRVLSVCLKDNKKEFESIEKSMKRYRYDDKGKPLFIVNEEKYTAKDFAEIKKIICMQNDLELPDENISKEVRDSLEKAKLYKNKIGDEKLATLEDYIISLAILTGWNFDYIYDMTIRKFTRCLKRMDLYIHYKIFLSASMSGMVEFKDKSFIKHWLNGLDSNIYKDVSVDLSTVQDKISFESAKK
jgi:hypothetical protein